MGQIISSNKDELSILIYVGLKEKPITCKKISDNIQFEKSYSFWKPSKKLNYLQNPKIQINVEKKRQKLHNIPSLFEAKFNLTQNLTPNYMGEKKYLESRIEMIENNVSIVVRINSKTHLIDEIVLLLPSDIYNNEKIEY